MAARQVYEKLKSALYPQPDVQAFVVVDGAAVPDLLPKIGAHRPQYARLLTNSEAPTLPRDAPHVIHLVPDDPFTRWVADEGWGNNWGVFALARVGLAAMRYHFQGLLDPAGREGKPLLDRFFDPRVLRVCLREWPVGQKVKLFGPVLAYLMEDEGGKNLLAFGGFNKPR
jgi:hypothetical protein